MKCSIVHQVRDAVRDAGGRIVDTDHGWTADIEDVLRCAHRLDVRYTQCDNSGLEAAVSLHSAGVDRPIDQIEAAGDCINLTGSDDTGTVTMCVATGSWPVIDVAHLATTAPATV